MITIDSTYVTGITDDTAARALDAIERRDVTDPSFALDADAAFREGLDLLESEGVVVRRDNTILECTARGWRHIHGQPLAFVTTAAGGLAVAP